MANWLALGDRAIRFARPAVSARALVRDIRSWPDVVDVVVTRSHVAVYFDAEPACDPERVTALSTLPDEDVEPREVELRVHYDGQDLAELARVTGLDEGEVQRIHAAVTYSVDSIGFAPGFAYLTGLDPRLHVPRRATPRPRVPAGSLAIADAFTAVYPFDSPGGWHLIGRVVDTRMFDDNGALLSLGDRVRFVS